MTEQSFPITVDLLERPLIVYRGCRAVIRQGTHDRDALQLRARSQTSPRRLTRDGAPVVSMFEDGDRLRRLAAEIKTQQRAASAAAWRAIAARPIGERVAFANQRPRRLRLCVA
jgi:hypothetical protein